MIKITRFFSDLIFASLFIVFYLLFEKELQAGYFIAILLAYYINSYANKFWKYAAILAVYFVFRYFLYETFFPFLYYLFMVSLVFFMKDNSGAFLASEIEEMKIPFRPYEKELRRILFKYNPSQLNKVDSWLDKYKGREQVFLSELYYKYEGPQTPSKVSNSFILFPSSRSYEVYIEK
jgi:hypothetical protein